MKKDRSFLSRLVYRICDAGQSNNATFEYYRHKVNLQSGTEDYVDASVDDGKVAFTFDFFTKELKIEKIENKEQREEIVKAFKELYSHIKLL